MMSGVSTSGQVGELRFLCTAVLQAKQRRIGIARRLWERALNLAPHSGYAITGLAALEARSGNHQRALE